MLVPLFGSNQNSSCSEVAQPLLAVRKRVAGTRLCNFCGTWRMLGPRGPSPMSSGRRVGWGKCFRWNAFGFWWRCNRHIAQNYVIWYRHILWSSLLYDITPYGFNMMGYHWDLTEVWLRTWGFDITNQEYDTWVCLPRWPWPYSNTMGFLQRTILRHR